MIVLRPAAERGHTDLGWLDSRHTFSFGDYHDPGQMGFSHLRVINDDRVRPAKGFATHGHRDMEILSYVLEGSLQHRDSMGTGSVIRPGDVQRMTAGTGVTHSEFNPSKNEPVRFLQIWIVPERTGLKPGYEQKQFSESEREGRLRLVASPDGRDGSVRIHQDASVFIALLGPRRKVAHAIPPGRVAWVQVARGAVLLNGTPLAEGDGAAISQEKGVEISGPTDGPAAEVLLFDLA